MAFSIIKWVKFAVLVYLIYSDQTVRIENPGVYKNYFTPQKALIKKDTSLKNFVVTLASFVNLADTFLYGMVWYGMQGK